MAHSNSLPIFFFRIPCQSFNNFSMSWWPMRILSLHLAEFGTMKRGSASSIQRWILLICDKMPLAPTFFSFHSSYHSIPLRVFFPIFVTFLDTNIALEVASGDSFVAGTEPDTEPDIWTSVGTWAWQEVPLWHHATTCYQLTWSWDWCSLKYPIFHWS